MLKQADVVLALFLQGAEFTTEEKLANFEYYDPLTTGDSTLSGVVQSIIAAEVGYHELALEYFKSSLLVDLENRHANASDGVHVASAGGTWSALAFGFGGMRDDCGRISFDPRLPQAWESLTFRVSLRGARLKVTVTADAITFVCETARAPRCWCAARPCASRPASPVTVALDGQGPRLYGAPTMRDVAGSRRADGTLLTASMPTLSLDLDEEETVVPID